MQKVSLPDNFNPLNILAVAAGLQHRQSCNTDTTETLTTKTVASSVVSPPVPIVKKLNICKIAEVNTKTSTVRFKLCSDITKQDIAPRTGTSEYQTFNIVTVNNNDSTPNENITKSDSTLSSQDVTNDSDMKLLHDSLLDRHTKQNDVGDMFEEHNYGTCRTNFANIIEDEPFNTELELLKSVTDDLLTNERDYSEIVCTKSTDRRHDSGFSETDAIVESITNLEALDDSGLGDSSYLADVVESLDNSDCCTDINNILNGNAFQSSDKRISDSDSKGELSVECSSRNDSPNDVFISPAITTSAAVSPVLTPPTSVSSVSYSSSGINNRIDSRDTSNNIQIDEAGTTSQQTIIKSLLTGRTIIVVPKPDNDSVDTRAHIRSHSVTSPSSCESTSSVILSPDSAYSTDSNMADETFFRRTALNATKNEPYSVDSVNKKIPNKCKSTVELLHPGIPTLNVSDASSIALKKLEDSKENLSELLTQTCNTISDVSPIKTEKPLIKCTSANEGNHEYVKDTLLNLKDIYSISSPIKETSVNVEKPSPSRVGQFCIGSFASFSNNTAPPPSVNLFKNRPTSQIKPQLSQTVVTDDVEEASKPSSLFNAVSVAPSDILDVHVSADNSSIDPISLDHGYSLDRNTIPPVPIPRYTVDRNPIPPITMPPKLGRPPTRSFNKRRRSSTKKDQTETSKPPSPVTLPPSERHNVKAASVLSLRVSEDIKAENVITSPTRRSCRREESFDEPEDQESKVKITGNTDYKDQFVYYASKSERTTRRQRTKLPVTLPGHIFPVPTAADIVIPRLSDADIVALQEGSPPPSGLRVPPFHDVAEKIQKSDVTKPPETDDTQVINTILNLETNPDDMSFSNFSSSLPTDELSELTTEQMNMLFNAIDEIQADDTPEKPDPDEMDLDSEAETEGTNESNLPETLESLTEPTLDNTNSDTNVSVKDDKNTDSDNTPWIVIVTIYWNDLPAVMIDMHPYVRLIDIYKQILPAKDTGILKKRCQLMGLEVRNCTEMQRYFLVKYGHAHISKSSVVISKDDAKSLIAFYVEPQQKVVKPDPRRKKDYMSRESRRLKIQRPELLRQVVTPSGDERIPRPVFTEGITNPLPAITPHVEPLERLRHKKINFRGMLRGVGNSDNESDEDDQRRIETRGRKPRKALTKRMRRNTSNNKSVIKRTVRNPSSDGPRFSRREPRCRMNGFDHGVVTNGDLTPTKRTSHRLSSSRSDQNTQTAQLSDDLTTDSESLSPVKRRLTVPPVSPPKIRIRLSMSDLESSPKHNLRSSPLKRKLDMDSPVSPSARYSTRSHSSDSGTPSKRSRMVINDRIRSNSSSVITLSNGPAEYQTYTALDEDLSC